MRPAPSCLARDRCSWRLFAGLIPTSSAQLPGCSRKDWFQQIANLLPRIHAPGDTFYTGYEGGIAADNVLAVADYVDSLPGSEICGSNDIPGPAVLRAKQRALPTICPRCGAAPDCGLGSPGERAGTNSSVLLASLAEAVPTEVEPQGTRCARRRLRQRVPRRGGDSGAVSVAFMSTREREQGFGEDVWRQRLGSPAATFVAWRDGEPERRPG